MPNFYYFHSVPNPAVKIFILYREPRRYGRTNNKSWRALQTPHKPLRAVWKHGGMCNVPVFFEHAMSKYSGKLRPVEISGKANTDDIATSITTVQPTFVLPSVASGGHSKTPRSRIFAACCLLVLHTQLTSARSAQGLSSYSGSSVKETRIVSPRPSMSSAPMPIALFIRPSSPSPASVTPRCKG